MSPARDKALGATLGAGLTALLGWLWYRRWFGQQWAPPGLSE